MQYPGNPDLSGQAQERVLTTFKQAVQKLHAGAREESMIALEFVLRLDPQFAPARQLHEQLTSGAEEVDLSSIIGQLQEKSDTKVDQLLVDAVDDYNERRFHQAKEKVERVLRELPGHKEARNLRAQIEDSLKTEAQVGQYLVQAREALDRGEAEESANFVMMAQALDPHHPGIAAILTALEDAGAFIRQEPLQPEGTGEGAPPSFETTDLGAPPSVDQGPAAGSEQVADHGFDNILGDQAPSEVGWSFEEPGPQAGAAPSPEPAPPPPAPEGSGVDDLFDAGDEPSFESLPSLSPAETGGQVQELLIEGKTAFEAGDYRGAIDRWSRIFLGDPENPEAARLIEDAHRRKEEQDRLVGKLLEEAEEALTQGRSEDARQLVLRASEMEPGNVHALDLLGGLEGAAPVKEPAEATAPASPEEAEVTTLDDLDIDLFDESVPPPEPAAMDGPSLDLKDIVNSVDEAALELPAPRRKAKLSTRTLALIGVGVLVVALGAWFGARLFSGHQQQRSEKAVERALQDAEELYREGHPKDAVRLLEALQVQGPDQILVSRRLARYKKALLPPTPTPAPEEATTAQELFDGGQLVEAYVRVQAGLEKYPSDPGLQNLRKQILDHEASIGPLTKALSDKDFETALGICRTLLQKEPQNTEYQEILERSLFNLAISELRKYNLTEADGHLEELQNLKPDDEEVQRIRRFIAKYKTRPADMQLKIFIASLGLR